MARAELKIHLLTRSGRTACGKGSDNVDGDERFVTCGQCLRHVTCPPRDDETLVLKSLPS